MWGVEEVLDTGVNVVDPQIVTHLEARLAYRTVFPNRTDFLNQTDSMMSGGCRRHQWGNKGGPLAGSMMNQSPF